MHLNIYIASYDSCNLIEEVKAVDRNRLSNSRLFFKSI